jgi:hypothetical protein
LLLRDLFLIPTERHESVLDAVGQLGGAVDSLDIDLLTVTLDIDAWTRRIIGSVERGIRGLPS